VTVIDVKALGKHAEAAVQFLSSRFDAPLKVRRGQIQLTSINDRAAKLLLHKFLRREKLENYRVVTIHPGLIRVLEPMVKKKIPYERPRSSAVPLTIPQYQVGAELGGLVPKPGERKWKRSR
jgi:hypothetical protein